MRSKLLVAVALAGTLGCGIESVFNNAGHDQIDRPASKITGTVPAGVTLDQISVIDGDGTTITPFLQTLNGTSYELRLPSSKYSMLRVRVSIGNMELRTIVPSISEESGVTGVDLDARNMAETLIAEARLSADGDTMKKVTPAAYLGTRALIRADLDGGGPAQNLAAILQRVIDQRFDPTLSVLSPQFFNQPAFCRKAIDATCNGTAIEGDYVLKTSALDRDFLLRNPLDYMGDGRARSTSDDFDKALAQAAQTFRPAGCPSPDKIRLVFTVDFNANKNNGNCRTVNRFAWATDKSGKSMFFVGWIYDGTAGLKASDVTNPEVAKQLGSSTPNIIPMYDDGTNGDQTAGDSVWTVVFDVPKGDPPGTVLRVGYKYTWGTQGAPWTGSEEWPGNSRILEVVDDNGDNFVYRHDVFGDEATNKDKANLNTRGTGSLEWNTDLHGCNTPESHENSFDNDKCQCAGVLTPKWLGSLTVPCSP